MGGMKGRPNLALMAGAILLLSGAIGIHIACMCLPQYAALDIMSVFEGTWRVNKADNRISAPEKMPDLSAGGPLATFVSNFECIFGLWELCLKSLGLNVCIDFTRDPLFPNTTDLDLLSFHTPSWLYISQLASIAAAVSLGLTLGSAFCILIRPRSNMGKPYYAAALAIFAGLVTLTANLIFMTQKNMDFMMRSSFMQQNFGPKPSRPVPKDLQQALLDVYNDSLENGPMLLANMASPFLAILAGIAFVFVGVLDRRHFEREVYTRNQDEGIKLT